jgi:hypothetical protein
MVGFEVFADLDIEEDPGGFGRRSGGGVGLGRSGMVLYFLPLAGRVDEEFFGKCEEVGGKGVDRCVFLVSGWWRELFHLVESLSFGLSYWYWEPHTSP